jgi:hypothetical protein
MYRYLILFAFFLSAACTQQPSRETPVPLPTPTVAPTIALTVTPTSSTTPSDWRVKEVYPWRITLNSYRYTADGIFAADITAELLAKNQLAISSLMQFAARNSDGADLDRTIKCGNTLDGVVLPGKKMRGEMCWKHATAPVTLLFQAQRGGKVVYWELEE